MIRMSKTLKKEEALLKKDKIATIQWHCQKNIDKITKTFLKFIRSEFATT